MRTFEVENEVDEDKVYAEFFRLSLFLGLFHWTAMTDQGTYLYVLSASQCRW